MIGKKKIITFYLLIFFTNFVFSINNLIDNSNDLMNFDYIPWVIKVKEFDNEIIKSIDNSSDLKIINSCYYKEITNVNYYLKTNLGKKKKTDLLLVLNKYENTKKILIREKQKVLNENSYPVFLQKGGMLKPKNHSFYFRTDDEWTGFSTIFLGYRFAPNEYFNLGFEGGAGLPQLYLFNILFHFKIFESLNKSFFIGLRIRMGYKYQHTESFMFIYDSKTGENKGYLSLGKDYLTIYDRHSLYIASDLTFALRFGRLKAQSVYYTIYPKFDFGINQKDFYFLLCPIMSGYEVRFGRNMEWSFAVEGGYAFPVPWGSVPDGKWINFPSLANVSVNYFFGK